MMERRAFLLSLGVSALSMFLVWQYITNEEKMLQDLYGEKTSEEIVVTSRDILQYQTIKPSDIETLIIPKAMLPAGRIRKSSDIIDSIAAVPMTKGDFILDNKIISKNIYSGLNTQISFGKRAISVPVNVTTSMAYLLRPGNRVDLGAHFEYKTKDAAISEVKIFMQDLLILAAGRTIQANPPRGVDQKILRTVMGKFEGRQVDEAQEMLNHAKSESLYSTISLEVTPEQTQKIVYVLTVFSDSIICMLRHSDDRQLPRIPTVNLFDVMGPDSYLVKGNKGPPPQAIPRPKFFDFVGNQQVPVY